MEVTEGRLLDGRLLYAQPRDGYRTGIEPVLLAASVPAQPGQRVLEAGTGAGAGLLCLAARVSGLALTGLELDPEMADLARRNLAANGIQAEIVTGDVTSGVPGRFDHAFANPPWHDPASTPSPLARRQRAKQASGAGLAGWIASLREAVQPGGTLTLILPPSQADSAASCMRRPGPAALRRLKLLPKAGRPPKLVLLQWTLTEGADQTEPGLILHEDDGRYTAAAEAVLRQAAALKGSSS